MGPSWDKPLPDAQVPKNKFNQISEKIQKQRKAVKQVKIIIVQVLNKNQGPSIPPQEIHIIF